MKIILPGGAGQIGRILTRAFTRVGDECVILTRDPEAFASTLARTGLAGAARALAWDGRSLGPWAAELEGADAVINLAGRSVDCRYTERNLAEMLRSRVDSTRAVGAAIAAAKNPPRVWLQASTATIYAHRFDAPNDEATGLTGGTEPGVPALWKRSVEIGLAWERELFAAAMGPQGDGMQFVSWVHEYDFVAALRFLLAREDIDGVVTLAAPRPLPNRDFVAAIHAALGRRLSVPAPVWLLELGAFFRRTETELLLKSRRVVPGRLLAADFRFRHPDWPAAARDLVARWRHPAPPRP